VNYSSAYLANTATIIITDYALSKSFMH
jgi:hypothetical protein